jgi:hypothetical protein
MISAPVNPELRFSVKMSYEKKLLNFGGPKCHSIRSLLYNENECCHLQSD